MAEPPITLAAKTAQKPILNSWKEIARYFDRGVRTVQRWEQALGLPVHRVAQSDRAPVFAYSYELDRWLAQCAKRSQFPLQSSASKPPLAEASKPDSEVWQQIRTFTQAIHESTERLCRTIETLQSLTCDKAALPVLSSKASDRVN